MEGIEGYRSTARQLGSSGFILRNPGFFLLKRPHYLRQSVPPVDSRPSLPFRTEMVRAADSSETEFEDEHGGEWRMAMLDKRIGNPFPDRISVGRAPNCDVVLRFPQVSKLHAHFFIEGTRVTLADQRSSNGTQVNGRDVPPKEIFPLRVGDRIKFGGLELELADALRFYGVLVSPHS